jgi:glycosyltransferase involved in cell wall biosynthesis
LRAYPIVTQGWIVASVVIAAHNEAAVIGRCLDALQAGDVPGGLDITVVANGCTDGTAEVCSARPGVRVLTLPDPGKAAALNAGDAVAVGYPRIYLDADIVISAGDIAVLADALTAPPDQTLAVLAVVPGRRLDASRSSLLVRAYSAINSRLPVFRNALFGRGVIALSEPARGRFAEFPSMAADDLFLDSLFAAHEKRELEQVVVRVAAPRKTADLLRRLIRVRRGNAAMRAAAASDSAPAGVRESDRMSWLTDVVAGQPALIPAGVAYAAITTLAAVLARMPQRGSAWGRDESTRLAALKDAETGLADGQA